MTATQLLGIGQRYFSEKQWEEAIQYLDRALRFKTGDVTARRMLGEALMHVGKVEEALEHLQAIYQENPTLARTAYSRALVAKAKTLEKAWEDVQALEYCERALEINPSDGEAFKLRINIWVRRGDNALLKDDLEKAAHAYRQAGDVQKSTQIQTLHRWQSLSGIEKQAQTLMAESRWAEAVELYRQLLALVPADKTKKSWKNALARCLEEQELEKIYIEGKNALDMHQWAQAQSAFLRLITRRPNYRKGKVWITELLHHAVTAETSSFVPELPATAQKDRLLPTSFTQKNIHRVNRLARWGRGRTQMVAFAETNQFFAIASSIGVYFYHAKSLKPMGFIDTDQWIESMALSADGALLACGLQDGAIWLWRVADQALVRVLRGHTRKVNKLAFSPDGDILASAADDGTARLWRVLDGVQVRMLQSRLQAVKSLAFSPKGDLIVLVATDHILRVHDPQTGEQVGEITGHMGAVRRVSFSPDGRRLATAADDGIVRIWSTKTLDMVTSLRSYSGIVRELIYSPSGKTLAVGSWDGLIRLWEIIGEKMVATLDEHTGVLNSFHFSPDGNYLLSTAKDNTVRLWDAEAHTLLHTINEFQGGITRLAWMASDRYVVAAYDDARIGVWRTSDGKKIVTYKGLTHAITCLAVGTNSQMIAAGSQDGQIRLWHHTDEPDPRTITLPTESALALAFKPDDASLLIGSADGKVYAWDLHTETPVEVLRAHRKTFRAFCLLADGETLVTAGDSFVRFWNLSDASLLGEMKVEPEIQHFQVNVPQNEIYGVDVDGRCVVWGLESRSVLRTIPFAENPVRSLCLHPRGDMLATLGQGNVLFTSLPTGETIHSIDVGEKDSDALAVSEDGTLFITGGESGVIKVWGVLGE